MSAYSYVGDDMSTNLAPMATMPKYPKPEPKVQKTCTTVRLTERQYNSLPKLKTATEAPSLAVTVILILHQAHDDLQNQRCQPDEYSPSNLPNPFTYNFVVTPEERSMICDLKQFYGMKTNTQLIGFLLDKYASALDAEQDGE